MSAILPLADSPPPEIQCRSQVKVIRDYTLHYSAFDVSIPGNMRVVFPQSGYLVLFFITGDLDSRFLNYHQLRGTPHHFCINGLFSEGSLVLNHSGTGGGYALHIHPVIGYYLLGMSLDQLTNRQLLFNEAIGKKARVLRELEADFLVDPFGNPYLERLLNRLLPEKSLYRNDPLYHAVNTVIRKRGCITVRELADRFHMSERTLNRQFLMKTGLSPQAYAKIWQMQYAMKLLLENPEVSLAQIAFDSGYYDVAHLARDFRSKVALAPSRFSEYMNTINRNYLNLPGSLQ